MPDVRAVFRGRIWQAAGVLWIAAAVEVALISFGPEWFGRQPAGLYVGVLAGFGILWWFAVGDRPVAPSESTAAATVPPQLICTANASEADGCVVPGTQVPLPAHSQTDLDAFTLRRTNSIGATYFRLKVDVDRPGQIADCCARLVSIERDDRIIFNSEPYFLPFVTHGNLPPHGKRDPLAMTVSYGASEYVDVIVITDDNEIWLVTPGYADRLTKCFVETGTYTIRFRIISPHGAGVSVPAAVAITWTGVRKTSAPTWREATPAISPGTRWPDFQKWDEKNLLCLFEAACLWNDEEPALPMSDASLRTFWDLYKAVYEKRLATKADLDEAIKLGMAQTGWPLAPNENDPVNTSTKVPRKHLKAYAEKLGVRPRFLFPDQRAVPRRA